MSDMEKRQEGAQAALRAKARQMFVEKHGLILKRRISDENGTVEMYIKPSMNSWPVVIAIHPTGAWGVYVCTSMDRNPLVQDASMHDLIMTAVFNHMGAS